MNSEKEVQQWLERCSNALDTWLADVGITVIGGEYQPDFLKLTLDLSAELSRARAARLRYQVGQHAPEWRVETGKRSVTFWYGDKSPVVEAFFTEVDRPQQAKPGRVVWVSRQSSGWGRTRRS